jgi:hypothetical protein
LDTFDQVAQDMLLSFPQQQRAQKEKEEEAATADIPRKKIQKVAHI